MVVEKTVGSFFGICVFLVSRVASSMQALTCKNCFPSQRCTLHYIIMVRTVLCILVPLPTPSNYSIVVRK